MGEFIPMSEELKNLPPPPRKQYDNINPDHYKGGNGLESINVIEEFNLSFALGNAVKYILRAGKKPGQPKEQDIKKSIWYLERELKNLNK